jgi:hypothetical protein
MTTGTTKRKTTARKPAKARAAVNGHPNGQPVAAPTDALAPEEFVPREPPDLPEAPGALLPAHPYGNLKIQVFTPIESEGEEIIVPHISTIDVTEEFLWDNHKKNLDLMQQSWRWMDLARIPDDVQRQIVRLAANDKRRFWQEWFAGFVPPPTGEPPGES